MERHAVVMCDGVLYGRQYDESSFTFRIYTKKQGDCKYGPQFPRKQWARAIA